MGVLDWTTRSGRLTSKGSQLVRHRRQASCERAGNQRLSEVSEGEDALRGAVEGRAQPAGANTANPDSWSDHDHVQSEHPLSGEQLRSGAERLMIKSKQSPLDPAIGLFRGGIR
jgi:hypothetical protein